MRSNLLQLAGAVLAGYAVGRALFWADQQRRRRLTGPLTVTLPTTSVDTEAFRASWRDFLSGLEDGTFEAQVTWLPN